MKIKRQKRYPVQLDKETYEKLVALADANGRTIGGQVKMLLKDVEFLPRPTDANPIPVVYQTRPE